MLLVTGETSFSKPLRFLLNSELVLCVIFFPILQKNEPGEEVAVNFLELIQILLEDPEARQAFFMVRHYNSLLLEPKSSCQC